MAYLYPAVLPIEGSCGSPHYFRGIEMDRVVVFVDAGYLFAQGSLCVSGKKEKRADVELKIDAVVAELLIAANDLSKSKELLRIYWYDGATESGPTDSHKKLASTQNVKLRLGFINSHGQQKGVDSLIVTDMIELARNHAMSDVVILAGDEDLRVGVQVAQNFGVRVHLLGIHPSRGSQSLQLIREADTHSEWNSNTVSKFLNVKISATLGDSLELTEQLRLAGSMPLNSGADPLFNVACNVFYGMTEADKLIAADSKRSQGSLPHSCDSQLLVRARTEIGRELTPAEKRMLRKYMGNMLVGNEPKATVSK